MVGLEISRSLLSGKYSDFKIAVAYSKNSGIGRIYNDLLKFSDDGGTTSVIAGIDQGNTSYREIIEKTIDLPFYRKNPRKSVPSISSEINTTAPSLSKKFSMTLSNFDVSEKSSDPVILIPIAALKMMPTFWNWPMFYTDSGAGYPQLYATATIVVDGKTHKDKHIRIYYYKNKSEFRLQCDIIKRSGKAGDIVSILKNHTKPHEFVIELTRSMSPDFGSLNRLLTIKVSTHKSFAYL